MMPKLTNAASLASLPPGEHYDHLVVGLIFFVGVRRRVWIMRPRISGKRTRITLGLFPQMTLTQAREAARMAQVDHLRGKLYHPNLERPTPVTPGAGVAPPQRMSLQQLLNAYEVAMNADPRRPAMRSMDKRIKTMQRELAAHLNRPADALAGDDIRKARDRIVERGARIAANRFLAELRPILKWAAQSGRIPANPMPDLDRYREEARERVLTEKEIEAIWRASLEGDTSTQRAYGRLIRFLLVSAQRLDEAAMMPYREIVEGVWRLPPERNKGKRLHYVPLTERMKALIGSGHPDELAFRSDSGKLAGWSDLKETFDARCGVKEWRLHDLRRTAATFLDNDSRVPGEVIERLLNHALPGVGGVYRKGQMVEEKLAALNVLDGIVPPAFR